jgi:alkanesulfonate monooxygenase SsuD/methylene tetrahydromethanopterin reductase-like flavin-dependent oxidoreductase (luciferase family)
LRGPTVARLAPETGRLRLEMSMLLLPLLNPVDAAENVATLDHITHGRLDAGVAIGYRQKRGWRRPGSRGRTACPRSRSRST